MPGKRALPLVLAIYFIIAVSPLFLLISFARLSDYLAISRIAVAAFFLTNGSLFLS